MAAEGQLASPGDVELGSAGTKPAQAAGPSSDFQVDKSQLEVLAENRELPDLEAIGGVESLANKLHSNVHSGLTDAQVELNREKFGRNVMPDKPVKTLLQHFWESLDDLTLAILQVCCSAWAPSSAKSAHLPCRSLPPPRWLVSSPSSSVSQFPRPTAIGSRCVSSSGHARWCAITPTSQCSSPLSSLPGSGCRHSGCRDCRLWRDELPELHSGPAVRCPVWCVDDEAVAVLGALLHCTYPLPLAAVKEDRLVEVRRNGQDVDISIYDVVVGDLFRAKSGEVMPCDGVLVSGQNVKADESSMTGESKAVAKSPRFPFMVGGSKLVSGDGRLLVTTVGEDTSYGRIVKAIQNEPEKETPLQQKLERLAIQIGYVGFVFGALTTVVIIIAYFASGRSDTAGVDGQASIFIEMLRAIVLGITIVVVAVPEGLPLAVTISLAFSMKRMYSDKCLVRELAACETMGSATAICSDKTGTLTENRMTVKRGSFLGNWVNGAPSSTADVGGDATAVQVVSHSCALNATARVQYPDGPDGKPFYVNSPTEGCLLHMVHEAFGVDFDALRDSLDYEVPFYREPFSSERKRMTTVHKGVEEWHGEYVCFVKGASEIVLGSDIAAKWRTTDGEILSLDDEVPEKYAAAAGAKAGETMRQVLLRNVDEMASDGFRTLGIGYRPMAAADLPMGAEDADARDSIMSRALHSGELEAGLIITAVVGIEDPVRAGVPEAVARCMSAGIRVRMCTGDNQKTAANIAKQCGILAEGAPIEGHVMLGKAFRALSDEQRLAALPTLDVLARSSPHDKLLLVKGLQTLGETVSVTGDGTNDAPALTAADIGLAMGIAGTEVAKEASKIVITDDRFTSIVTAVKWGRSVLGASPPPRPPRPPLHPHTPARFPPQRTSASSCSSSSPSTSSLSSVRALPSLQCGCQCFTPSHSPSAVTIIIATTNEGDTSRFPINPVQLLWINLIMDSFAALALATEPPNEALLEQRPVRREDRLMTPYMWRNMIGHSIVQVALLLWLSLDRSGAEVFLLDSDKHFQDQLHYTCVFNAFVWLQITNKINCRKLHNELNVFEGIFESGISLFIILVIIAGQVFIVEVGGDITLTSNLGVEQWFICIALGLISFPVGFLLKFVPIPARFLEDEEGEGADQSSAQSGAGAASSSDAVLSSPTEEGPGATSEKLVAEGSGPEA